MSTLALLAAGTLGLAPPVDCRAEPPLEYVCGPVKPEDVVTLPGTPWLIASGFSPGAGLKLIDTRTRAYRFWQVSDAKRRTTTALCAGPPDAAVFNVRGLSLRQISKARWQLLAVNHGGRESIERFVIETNGSHAPKLRWRDCLPMPPGQIANSVASFADGTVLATVLTRPGTTIADFVQGRSTGGVWQWGTGEKAFALLPGTELPGNNGIETDPDGHRFYVVAFGWHAVVVYDRRDTSRPLARVDASDFMPDNIHWSAGRLLLAGMRLGEPACGGLRKIVDGVADPMSCHRGWTVGELNPSRLTISTVVEGSPQPGFNGLSAAAIAAGKLWLGSFQASRLAIAPLQRGGERR